MRYNVYATDKGGRRFAVAVGLEIHAAEQRADDEVNYGGWAERGVCMQPQRAFLPGDTAIIFQTMAYGPDGPDELAGVEYLAGESVLVLAVDGGRARVTSQGTCPRWMPVDNLA